MLTEKDFIWKEHKANNIPTNPLEEYYCLIDLKDCVRKYSIVPQYPEIDTCCIDTKADPELYILFEAVGDRATDEDKERYSFIYESNNYDGCLFKKKSFVRAYKTMEEAKKRAYLQYRMIYGFALSHIVDDVEASTKDHICI